VPALLELDYVSEKFGSVVVADELLHDEVASGLTDPAAHEPAGKGG